MLTLTILSAIKPISFHLSSTGYNNVMIIHNTPNEITDKIFSHSLYVFLDIWKDANIE